MKELPPPIVFDLEEEKIIVPRSMVSEIQYSFDKFDIDTGRSSSQSRRIEV